SARPAAWKPRRRRVACSVASAAVTTDETGSTDPTDPTGANGATGATPTAGPGEQGGSAAAVVERLRADLTAAMRERDRVAIRVLRTTIAAIANAEAPPASVDARSTSDEPVVGQLVEHE